MPGPFNESFARYSFAIVFQMKKGDLIVQTRRYQKHYGSFLYLIPVTSTYIQQEGYVYKMLDVLEPPKASEASGVDL